MIQLNYRHRLAAIRLVYQTTLSQKVIGIKASNQAISLEHQSC